MLILALVSAAVLVACSAAPSVPKAAPELSPAPAATAASVDSAGAPGRVSGSAAVPTSPGAPALAVVPWDRMIIRTVSLVLVVKDVEASVVAARDIAGAAGGFIAQSNTRYDGEHQLATLTLQVPASQYDTVVASLRQLAVKVDSENGTSQDVTEEFTDLDAQVRNLRVTEASLQSLMQKATTMADIIAIQRELTSVRGEIEKRQGRMQFLSRRTEMSTITLSLRPEALGKSKPGLGWRPPETAREAWAASLEMLQAIGNVLITLVVFFWWLIPLIVIGWVVLRSRRTRPGPRPSSSAS